jgi:CHAT domain-containing protein
LRSGIILANANKFWRGDQQVKNGEDGILTAYELAQLDWQQTSLVVLSACETGLGDVKDSEGVFGLQRALKLAGVQNTILSLWQVPDAETAELMTLFYASVLAGKSIRESFFQAQKAMRAKYKPFAWAAFVLVE